MVEWSTIISIVKLRTSSPADKGNANPQAAAHMTIKCLLPILIKGPFPPYFSKRTAFLVRELFPPCSSTYRASLPPALPKAGPLDGSLMGPHLAPWAEPAASSAVCMLQAGARVGMTVHTDNCYVSHRIRNIPTLDGSMRLSRHFHEILQRDWRTTFNIQ
jgi:hypothetical protein